ncbi:MAG: MiaB/RimO family radical SAM methylthiotransferase [Coriobacteriia bacterium]|nr:MiaB/RimO family radical SAM methylthiotransferase [Coriobacteriia bacterium]
MSEAPRVAVKTLGCKVNQAESEAIASDLAVVGVTAATDEVCDAIVVNTCTVTGEADHKARKAIRHALGATGGPVVVTGCLAAIDPGGVAALGDRVVVEPDKARVAGRVAEWLGSARPASRGRGVTAGGAPDPASDRAPSRTRVQVKVQDGCDAFCTYCIVPYARGGPCSVSAADVVARVAALVDAGTAEVVLTGINIGRYADGDIGLPELIEQVAATGVPRIRISSIEPRDVTGRLLEVAARTPAFCRHLHIPLQSGSDRVLAAMGRPYDAQAFAETAARAREVLPGLAVTTDVIVGFPGEGEDDDAASRAFVASQRFARLHVFRYSARVGTPAAARSDQVSAATIAERALAMRALGDELTRAEGASRVGEPAELLIERVVRGAAGGARFVEGFTREYLRVRVADDDAVPGDLLRVTIGPAGPEGIVTAHTDGAEEACADGVS